MKDILRIHANQIIKESIEAVMPQNAVKRALKNFKSAQNGRTVIIAIGKAAWRMARCAADEIYYDEGIVITKYGHSEGLIEKMDIFEAGHPVPDYASFDATAKAVALAETLSENDEVLFLVSGGGSSLFELPLVSKVHLEETTNKLLKCGADIKQINTIRKRISAVKGGKFAELCYPAHVTCVILSDIVSDPIDMIASGPCCADSSTCVDALKIVEEYSLELASEVTELLKTETPKEIRNVDTFIEGNVRELVKAAEQSAQKLGYKTDIITCELGGFARDAGRMMAKKAFDAMNAAEPTAIIAGGETVVNVKGSGLGGRNQETALSAAIEIEGMRGVCIFSVGSDGTDGPTDAAGGYCDADTASKIRNILGEAFTYLENNDSYTALNAVGDLIITGPTGTNVNDLCVALVRPDDK